MVSPIKGGFKFDLKPPTRKPGTFTNDEHQAMSANLAKAGLSCSANTPEKMVGYAKQVTTGLHSSANPGPQSGITSFASGQLREDPDKPYHYVVDNTNPFFSKMSVVLENLDKIEKEKLYAVQSHHETKTFESTTAGAITKALGTVGQIIGEVSSGNIDPDQIANEMGTFIQQMTSTSEDDFTVSDSNPWFIVVPKLNDEGQYPAIGGVLYDFNMSIHNYKDKKVDQHSSSYEVNQRNIIFTDGDIFESIYKKVSGN